MNNYLLNLAKDSKEYLTLSLYCRPWYRSPFDATVFLLQTQFRIAQVLDVVGGGIKPKFKNTLFVNMSSIS